MSTNSKFALLGTFARFAKGLGKILAAWVVAVILLSLIFVFYYIRPVHIDNARGDTDYVWPSYSYWVTLTEGVSVGHFDSLGFNNASVINNPDFPATGYLIGAKAAKVELVPATPFATAVLEGNQIKLVPGNAIGGSEPVVVRVTTDKGKVVESRPLIFKNDTVLPNLFINNYSAETAIKARQTELTITGSVKCETGVGGLSYRILAVQALLDKNGLISKVTPLPVDNSFQSIPVGTDGNFSLNLDTSVFADGMYIVEFVAESAGGNKAAKAVAFNTLPEIEEVNGKMPAAKPQVITWIDAFDVYAVVTYQGDLESNYKTFARAEMTEGANALVYGNAKYTAQKAPTLSAYIAEVDGLPYYSGMPVVLPYGASKEPKYLTAYIDTGAAVSAVNYEITGEDVAGPAVFLGSDMSQAITGTVIYVDGGFHSAAAVM